MTTSQFKLRYLKISVFFYLLASAPTVAQIVPDTTLPVNSVVTPQDSTNLIEGGTKAGINLFHSFSQFDIPTGSTAFFNNAADIQNIFSRITGGSASHIDGIIKSNNTANLFLINPNGIIFGANAKLNIGGSFVATTANAIGFGHQDFFSASVPNSPQLLTVLPSSFLFNQIAAQPISSQANLQVATGQSLLLVGGNVSLNAGQLLAPGGRVELGGLAINGTVGLNLDGNNLNLNFSPQEIQRANAGLSNGSVVNVSAAGGGSIAINADNFNMTGESILRAGIASGMGKAQSMAGNVEINAKRAITLDGSLISSAVLQGSVGNAGNIEITTGELSLTNGALVSASTFGGGNAGSVTIAATDAVSLDGTISNGRSSAISSSLGAGGVGNGGNIEITTGSMSLTNGAQLIASTFGGGNAGSVTIAATDAVNLDGTNIYGDQSAVLSSVKPGAVGNGGNIEITTGSMSLTNGAIVSTSILGQGNAGSLTIVAKDAVILDGTAINGYASGVYSSVRAGAVGNGGNIFLTTNSLSLTNSAVVAAQAEGTGDAGNITNITARSVSLDNASITTGSVSGNGGNIANFQVQDLRLRNHSQIYTTAGTASGGSGNGGNINLKLDTIILLENSQISANAFEGHGGNINLNTTGLFRSLNSQITASSKFGLNGEVKVNTPGIDPSKALINLPETVTDVRQLVAQSCTSDGASYKSNLTVTGRGGLPANPTEILTGETVLVDLAVPSTPITKSPEITPQPISIKTQPQLIEATGWSLNSKGEVILLANASNVTPQKLWQSSPSCNGNG